MSESKAPVSGKYFIPLDENENLTLPATYTDSTESMDSSELQSISLKPGKIRFIKTLFILLVTLFTILIGWDLYLFYHNLTEIHWSLGYLLSALIIVILISLLLVIRSYRFNQKDLKSVNTFQILARRYKEEKSFGHSKIYLKELQKLYENKPQEILLKNAIESLPDYNNDVEVLNHLSEHFFKLLDKSALKIVSRYSRQTGVMVALSPLAIIDVIISLWRMVKMVDEIGQVYGLRPSFPGRFKLIRLLLNGMAIAGVSELATHAILDGTTTTAMRLVSTKIAQGIGVGLYVTRVGTATMALCRPIPYDDTDKPVLTDIVSSMKAAISTAFEKNKQSV